MNFKEEYKSLYERIKQKLKETGQPHTDDAIAKVLNKNRAGILTKMGDKGKINEEDYVWLKYKFSYLFENSTLPPGFNSVVKDLSPSQALLLLLKDQEELVSEMKKIVSKIAQEPSEEMDSSFDELERDLNHRDSVKSEKGKSSTQ